MNGLFLMEAHINITMVIKEKQCLQIFSQKPLRVRFYSKAAKLYFTQTGCPCHIDYMNSEWMNEFYSVA